ncbi:MAG: PAS domain-containing protein, partial [Anaerolineae bacterium]|nr:PAS domain-containing protein [Anaerolineae bacterium]
MSRSDIFYLIPYMLSFGISFSLGIYAWQRRGIPGARPFAWIAWAEASWTFFYMFELTSDSLNAKLFWDNAQFLGALFGPVAVLAFALDYTGHRLGRDKRLWIGLSSLMGVFVLSAFVFSQHPLIRPDAWIVDSEPLAALVYDWGWLAWLMSLIGYGLIIVAMPSLIAYFLNTQRIYRVQISFIVVGILIPVIGTVPALLDITLSSQRDISPLTFAVGNLFVAWGLFRYRMFDLVPVARNLVVDSIDDMMAVVDAQNRVIDLNAAAQHMLKRTARETIGQPVADIFAAWPDLLQRFKGIEQTHTEIAADIEGALRFFDLHISPLWDRLGQFSGRVLVVRDITARKHTEYELQQHRANLEGLVERRTAELLAAQNALAAERQRLAQNLHDSVTQTVFAANTIVEMLPRMLDRFRPSDQPDKLDEFLVELQQLTRGAMAELRALMIELRPEALAQTELGVLIKQLCDVFTGNTRVDVVFSAADKLFLPEDMQIAFYRVAQETLTSLALYTSISAVQVQLMKNAANVELTITASGPGFDPLTVT